MEVDTQTSAHPGFKRCRQQLNLDAAILAPDSLLLLVRSPFGSEYCFGVALKASSVGNSHPHCYYLNLPCCHLQIFSSLNLLVSSEPPCQSVLSFVYVLCHPKATFASTGFRHILNQLCGGHIGSQHLALAPPSSPELFFLRL